LCPGERRAIQLGVFGSTKVTWLRYLGLAAMGLGLALLARSANAAGASSGENLVQLPYTLYKLDNGMSVILHQDSSQPLVVVNINVQVGSRNETRGRTGFAHLFEHLMFMGTKRVPIKKFDSWMEREGGWNNAWTSNDRTDYYDVAPSHALPLLLWMEADRMTVLGTQIDLAKLDTQREVVRNERRQQIENQPYAKARLRLPELLYPQGHPYHHPVIGSHEDIESATVNDVRAFFSQHYVPANMSLVVAGDFAIEPTKARIDKLFGSAKAAPAPSHAQTVTAAALTGVVRDTIEDNVTLTKVIMAWLSPKHFAPGDAELDLLATVASQGKTSRLYKSLVYDKKLAQSVVAYQASQSLRSYFTVEVIARPGVSPRQIEAAVDEQLQRLRDEAVGQEELARAKTSYEMQFISQNRWSNARACSTPTSPTMVTRVGRRVTCSATKTPRRTVCSATPSRCSIP
jgi:predicted Zn-dependent peptidase